MLALLHLLATTSIALPSQLRPEDFSSDLLLYSALNAKYHLVCEFHGVRVATPKDTPEDRIQAVIVRNEKTGEAVEYDPPKTTWPPNFYYHDVWSPDGEWLVLSLGLLDGFQLIKASDALAELKLHKPKEFLLLTSRKSKDGLSHRFLGWQSPASFNFDVTIDLRTTSTYHFNLENFRLTPMFDGPGLADTYTTSKGKQAIPVDPIITAPHRK